MRAFLFQVPVVYLHNLFFLFLTFMLHPFSDKSTPIKASDKYLIESSGCKHSLLIKDATYEDEKVYSCHVEDVKTYAKLAVTGMLYISY